MAILREILNSLQSHDTYLIEFCPLLFWELNFSIVQNGCPGNAEVSGFQILPRYSFKSLCENWGLSSHVISPQTWFIQSQSSSNFWMSYHSFFIFSDHIILFFISCKTNVQSIVCVIHKWKIIIWWLDFSYD